MRLRVRLTEFNASRSGSSTSSTNGDNPHHFNLLRAVRLMPKFTEASVDALFACFERLAKSHRWLSEKLFSFAAASYRCEQLRHCQGGDLQVYAIALEAYRAKFRALRIVAEQTHVEFAGEKREAFRRCLRSEVAADLETLRVHTP